VRDVSPTPSDGTDTIAVREALRRLPARIRVAVVLHHMVGLSVAETAAAMGVSPNTAKSQLKRGLELLREDLA
jgi:RNA polymerase sigma-70 factor (ECF subfamily)